MRSIYSYLDNLVAIKSSAALSLAWLYVFNCISTILGIMTFAATRCVFNYNKKAWLVGT